MSAHDQMRMMLDELMGTGRDGESNKNRLKFDSSRVCKSFLLACCPHDILASTRMDLGDCAKVHDLALRADYEKAATDKDYYFDVDALEHLEQFIADCDRRTEIAKKKLRETQEDLTEEAAAKADAILKIGEEIGTKLAKAEALGAEGNVEDSIKLMQEIDGLNKLKNDAEEEFRNSMPASTYQQQKLRVCEVCGAYLGIHDNDRRLADHFGGKLHIGFIEIRERLDELRKTVAERRDKREKERDERRRRSRERSGSNGRRKSKERRRRTRSRERRKSRSRSRSRRGKSRERRRSRDKRRSRSRSHKRSRRRSRSRDRKSRSRSQEKKPGSAERQNGSPKPMIP